jgi:23S rRNA (uracil1939-C5)-methyltransferase
VEAAVRDAEQNAQINGAANCTFIAGKMETELEKAIRQIDQSKEIVAVLDPPRAGARKLRINQRHRRDKINKKQYKD